MKKGTFSILAITAFSTMLGVSVISPFLPAFAKQHGANGFWLGMIFAGFGISRGIIMPIVGRVSDRTGRKVFVSAGLLLFSVISLLYPVVEGVYALTAVRLVHGVAAGMVMPIVIAYIGESAEKGREGATTGGMNMMFYMGLAAGPLLGGLLDQYFGFDAVFHAMATLGVLTFLIVFFFLPDIKAKEGEAPEDLRKFSSLIKYGFIKAVLVIAVISTLMMAVFISFVPSLADTVNVNTEHIGVIISLGIFLAGILQIPFGRLSDRFDRPGKLIQIGAGMSVGMVAVLVMPLCPDFTALVVAGALLGVGASIAVPALTGISVSIGERYGMGAWMGILHAAMSVGLVLTPLVFGVVMDHLGIHAVFYLLGLVVFFGTSGYLLYIRRV